MKYSTISIKPNMAKALLVDAPVSSKASIEIANHIRGKKLQNARTILQDAINLKKPIPYKRFTNGPGHKKGKGIASGRFSVDACQKFIALISIAESNARDKGLSTKELVIKTLIVQRASRPWHYGRQTRRKMKRSHIEIIVQEAQKTTAEKEEEKTQKPEKIAKTKEEAKLETKKETKKDAPKKTKQKSEAIHSSVKEQRESKTSPSSVKEQPKVTEKMLKG